MRKSFADQLCEAPIIDWFTPIDEHYNQLIQIFDTAAKQCFSPTEKKQIKHYFTAPTIALVKSRKYISALLDYIPST